MRFRLPASLRREEESLAVQSIVLTTGRIVGFAITFAIPVVLVRVFDQSTFGVYKQLFLIAGTAIPILSMGLYASVFYFVPRDGGDGHRYVVQTLGLLCLASVLGALALVFAGPSVASMLGMGSTLPYFVLLAVFVAIATPTELVTLLPVADRRPVFAAYTVAGSDLVRAGAIIAAGLIGQSIYAVLWAAIATMVLRGVWLLLYLGMRQAGKPRRRSPANLGSQLRYSLPFAGAVFFEIGLTRFHQYYVAANVPAADFAIYSVGLLQIPILGLLVQSVVEVMLVGATTAHKAGNVAEMRRLWMAAVERLGSVLLPCWVFAQLFATDIIGLLFGADYLAAVAVFRVFLFSVLLYIVVDHGILRATGDTPYMLKANVVGMVAATIAILLLARQSMLVGGVGGYVVGTAVMRGMGLMRVAKRLEARWHELIPLGAAAPVALAALVSATAASVAFFFPTPFFRLLFGGLIFFATYGSLALRWTILPGSLARTVLQRFNPAYRLDS